MVVIFVAMLQGKQVRRLLLGNFFKLFVELVHETTKEFLGVVLLIASEHRVDNPDAVQDSTRNDVPSILAPHLLDELVVVLRQPGFRNGLIPQQVRLNN